MSGTNNLRAALAITYRTPRSILRTRRNMQRTAAMITNAAFEGLVWSVFADSDAHPHPMIQ